MRVMIIRMVMNLPPESIVYNKIQREWEDSFFVNCGRNGQKIPRVVGVTPPQPMVVKIVLTKCIELPNTLDNSIARTCIPANLRRKECENTKIPRAEVFPVLLFIIGLLSCFLQILFLFICHLSTSFYQERVNIQLYIAKQIICFENLPGSKQSRFSDHSKA